MKRLVVIVISLILILAVSICGCFNTEKNENSLNFTKNETQPNNNSQPIKILSKDNKSYISQSYNITNNTENTTKYDFSKQIDIEKMFLNLSYTSTINESNIYGDRLIKIYEDGNFRVIFDIRTYPVDFSNAYLYNEVKQYSQRDRFGDYICYEFISKSSNLSTSYCYYRKVGKYYILMQTNEKSRRANDLWINWTKHIFSLFEENISE